MRQPSSASKNSDMIHLSISASVRTKTGAFIAVENQGQYPIEHSVLRQSAIGIDHVSRKDIEEGM
jgi:hypothetical protein